MRGFSVFVLLIAGFCKGRALDSDADLDTLGLMIKSGYKAESHVATTDDGYLLTMHRIPGPEGSTPVFLQHGLLGSSSDWILTGRGKSLAYILADLEYDVWLGNFRGNIYSRAHKTLSTSDSRFWDFSFHEMGLYDLPAMISYVTKNKNQSLFYVGHSMGTTAFYVMASKRSDMNSKIKIMFSLAPVAFMGNLKSPVRLLSPIANQFEAIAHLLGADEFLPQSEIAKQFAKLNCEINTLEEAVCENALFVLTGCDPDQFNKTLLPVILGHTPAGTSTKSLVHYGQEMRSGRFRPYDYGLTNIIFYKSIQPSDYDLSKIEIPIALFYGDNDKLTDPTDVERLYHQLPKVLGKFRVDDPKFNHVDFLWAIEAPELVYKQLISMMKKFNN